MRNIINLSSAEFAQRVIRAKRLLTLLSNQCLFNVFVWKATAGWMLCKFYKFEFRCNYFFHHYRINPKY